MGKNALPKGGNGLPQGFALRNDSVFLMVRFWADIGIRPYSFGFRHKGTVAKRADAPIESVGATFRRPWANTVRPYVRRTQPFVSFKSVLQQFATRSFHYSASAKKSMAALA